jgi:RHS repeat-associated protein
MSCQPAAGVTGYIDPSPVHFTGQERDGETGGEAGNDFFSARYYSSGWARFMSPDPSGLSLADQSNPQTFNLYTYVLNNPINRVDPSGLGKCRSPNGLPVSPITSEGFNYDDIQDAFTCVISGGSWELDSSDNSCSIGSSTPWPCANGGNTPPVTEAINPPSPTASTGSSTSSTAPTDSQLPQIDDSGIEFPTFSGATLIGGGIAGAGGVQITNPLLLTVATQTAPKPAGPSNGPMIRIATSNYIFNGMHGNECEYMLFCPNGNTQSTCGAQAPAVLMEGPPVNPCRNYLHDSRLVVNGKCVPVGSAQLSSLPVDCN